MATGVGQPLPPDPLRHRTRLNNRHPFPSSLPPHDSGQPAARYGFLSSYIGSLWLSSYCYGQASCPLVGSTMDLGDGSKLLHPLPQGGFTCQPLFDFLRLEPPSPLRFILLALGFLLSLGILLAVGCTFTMAMTLGWLNTPRICLHARFLERWSRLRFLNMTRVAENKPRPLSLRRRRPKSSREVTRPTGLPW